MMPTTAREALSQLFDALSAYDEAHAAFLKVRTTDPGNAETLARWHSRSAAREDLLALFAWSAGALDLVVDLRGPTPSPGGPVDLVSSPGEGADWRAPYRSGARQ